MLFPVFSEGLAMICHDGNQGSIEETTGSQRGNQLSDNGVGVSNFPIVGLRLIPRSIGLGRGVGIMRIVKMNPKEKRAARLLIQPGECATQYLFPASLEAMVVVFS